MAAQAAGVLAPPEVLDVELDGGMAHHLAHHAGAVDHRPADAPVPLVGIKQDATELDLIAFLGVAVIDADHIAFFDEILPRAVFKHCVHGSCPRCKTFSNELIP